MQRIIQVRTSFLIALVLGMSGPCWAQTRNPLIESVDIQVPAHPTPVRIAGKRHLVYELHITNLRTIDVALTRIEVLDADNKTRLADLHDSDLANRLGLPGASPGAVDKRVIGAGRRAVIYQWLALDDAIATPAKLQHRVEYDLFRPSGIQHAIVADDASNVYTE